MAGKGLHARPLAEGLDYMAHNRVAYFDALNVVACFGVVSMHVNGLTHSFSPTLSWLQAFSVDCVFYWAVPVFFMLTGATLLDYRSRYATDEFLKKRVIRTLVPFLAWSLFSLLIGTIRGTLAAPVGPRSFIDLILNTKIESIYWFFIPLFAVYLSLPVLSLLSKNTRILWYLAVTGFLLNVLAPFFCELLGISWNQSLSLPVLNGYLIYVVLGFLLSHQDVPKHQARIIYFLGICSTLFRFVLTALASFNAGELVKIGWGTTSLPCFFEAMAIFLLFRRTGSSILNRLPQVKGALARLASCSLGIYLVHILVLRGLMEATATDYSDAALRLIGPFIVYTASLTIVLLLKRIPFLRRLVP